MQEESFLKKFPGRDELLAAFPGVDFHYEVNGHVHTPFSFSAFEDIKDIFVKAVSEEVDIVGVNDFNVVNGYRQFHDQALDSKVFPLFCIEYMALSKELQSKGIRVNDPNNPGRIYFCGKGLGYPFSADAATVNVMLEVVRESTEQVKEMIIKTSNLLKSIGSPFNISFDAIYNNYASGLVRERHIAKAIRVEINKHFSTDGEKKEFLNKLYSGKDTKVDISNNSALENELRNNLLKAGGSAFVPENEAAFLNLEQVKNIIINAGGIPCYPVLLDDKNGNYTEFEADMHQMRDYLEKNNVYCIELIPNRNNYNILKEFCNYFFNNGFVVTFGTEHNAPDMLPLKVVCRDEAPLDEDLLRMNYEGACVIAAHQYQMQQGLEGYLDANGKPKSKEREEFIRLGNAVINHFFNA